MEEGAHEIISAFVWAPLAWRIEVPPLKILLVGAETKYRR